VLQAQVFVPGPVEVQVALVLQPPLLVRHELIGVQVVPLPEYPVLHVHTGVLPFAVHLAVAAHPPLLTAQGPRPVQVVPLPV
jgi:hypothetical protein